MSRLFVSISPCFVPKFVTNRLELEGLQADYSNQQAKSGDRKALSTKLITQITRHKIFDLIGLAKIPWLARWKNSFLGRILLPGGNEEHRHSVQGRCRRYCSTASLIRRTGPTTGSSPIAASDSNTERMTR